MALKANRSGVRTDQVDAYGRVTSKSFLQSILDHLPRWTSLKVWKNGTEQLLPVNTDEPVTSPIVADIQYPTDSSATEQMFTYRESPTGADGEAYIKSIKGNTIIWNQLVQNGDFSNGTSGWDSRQAEQFSVVSGEGILNIATANQNNQIYRSINAPTNHVYFCGVKAKKSDDSNINTIRYGLYNNLTVVTVNTLDGLETSYKIFETIIKPTSDVTNIRISAFGTDTWEAGGSLTVDNIMCIDLTAMFGSTKADEILAMETAQVGSGVAYFRSLFPLPYYKYDAGSLLSFNGTGIKTTGKNRVFKTMEGSQINSSGVITSNTSYNVCVAEVRSGETYIITNGDSNLVFAFYTSEPNVGSVSYDGTRTVQNSKLITVPFNGYVAFRTAITYEMAQCEIGSTATSYEPYTTSTTTIPTDTYFPDGMMGKGTAFDEFTNSRAIHRMKQTDLGSLNWTYQSGNSRFQSYSLSEIIKPSTRNFLTTKYEYGSTTTTDQTIQIGANGYVYIKDSNYTDATTFKAAIDGLMLQYELAEEIVEPTLDFGE